MYKRLVDILASNKYPYHSLKIILFPFLCVSGIIYVNTLLGGVSIIMIEIMLSIGVGIVAIGLFAVSCVLVRDKRMEKVETEKYRQAMKYNFP